MPKLIHYSSKIVFVLALVVLAGCAQKNVTSSTLQSQDTTPAAEQASTPPADDPLSVLSAEYSFIKPTLGPVSSKFGMRRHPTKRRASFHSGIDINIKRGTPVMSAAPGKVVFVGVRSRAYGKTVEVLHGGDVITRYAHLDSITVREGEMVSPAVKIGTVGRTGRTTGPNLHFEVLAKGKPVNPAPLIAGTRDMDDPVSPYADNSHLQFYKNHTMPAETENRAMLRTSSSSAKNKSKTSQASKSKEKSTSKSDKTKVSGKTGNSKNQAGRTSTPVRSVADKEKTKASRRTNI